MTNKQTAITDAMVEELATLFENAFGGSSSQTWNDAFAQRTRDMKSTGRTPYKFVAMPALKAIGEKQG